MLTYNNENEKRAYVATIKKAIKQIEAWNREKRDLTTHMCLCENISAHISSLDTDIVVLFKLTRATIAEIPNVHTFKKYDDARRLGKLCEWMAVLAQHEDMDFS